MARRLFVKVGSTKALRPLVGLADRIGTAYSVRGVTNTVMQANWRDLETSPGVYDWAPIYDKITAAQAAGMTAGRLRVYRGWDKAPGIGHQAPDWIVTAAGVAHLFDPQDGTTPIEGLRWWNIVTEQTAFDAVLAAEFDTNPFIREVSMWGCGSEFNAEPMIYENALASNRVEWQANGFVKADVIAGTYAFVDMMLTHWHHTLINTWATMQYQLLDGDGSYTAPAERRTERNNYQAYCEAHGMLVGGNDLDDNSFAADDGYQNLLTIPGAWMAHQTATLAKIHTAGGTVASVSALAAANGALSLELPTGGTAEITAGQVTAANASMQATATALGF